MTTMKGMPGGTSTVARRVKLLAEDVSQQIHQNFSDWMLLTAVWWFSRHDGYSSADSFHLHGIQRLNKKRRIFSFFWHSESTRGEYVSNKFKRYVTEKNIQIKKLVSITTDGAPVMLGVNAGFIALCRNDPEFPSSLNYHCVIHQ